MIDSYEFGRIIINGVSYHTDLIVYPENVDVRWRRKEGHRLSIKDIEKALEYKPEVLIIGTGYYGAMKVPADIKESIISKGIELIILKTKEACHTYNSEAKSRKAIGAFHLTC